jgi:hypothetical protein
MAATAQQSPQSPHAYDLRAKLAELDADGFAVLPGLIPAATVATLRAAFLGLLDPIRARDRAEAASFVVPPGARPGQAFSAPLKPRSGGPAARNADLPVEGQRPGTTLVYVPEGAGPGATLDLPLAPREHGDIREGNGGLAETERYTMHLPVCPLSGR